MRLLAVIQMVFGMLGIKEGIITNVVTVNSTTPDTDMSNNRANNTTDVKPVCDVEVTKLVNASEIYFNDLVEWTVVVKNNGPRKKELLQML